MSTGLYAAVGRPGLQCSLLKTLYGAPIRKHSAERYCLWKKPTTPQAGTAKRIQTGSFWCCLKVSVAICILLGVVAADPSAMHLRDATSGNCLQTGVAGATGGLTLQTQCNVPNDNQVLSQGRCCVGLSQRVRALIRYGYSGKHRILHVGFEQAAACSQPADMVKCELTSCPRQSKSCMPDSVLLTNLQVWQLTSAGVLLQPATSTCIVPASIGESNSSSATLQIAVDATSAQFYWH